MNSEIIDSAFPTQLLMFHEMTKPIVITKRLNISITKHLTMVKDILWSDQNKLFLFFCYIYFTFNRF